MTTPIACQTCVSWRAHRRGANWGVCGAITPFPNNTNTAHTETGALVTRETFYCALYEFRQPPQRLCSEVATQAHWLVIFEISCSKMDARSNSSTKGDNMTPTNITVVCSRHALPMKLTDQEIDDDGTQTLIKQYFTSPCGCGVEVTESFPNPQQA